jgi:hypothetical protein
MAETTSGSADDRNAAKMVSASVIEKAFAKMPLGAPDA